MARIVVLTHATSDFARESFMLRRIVDIWRSTGHGVAVIASVRSSPSADVALLHIDLSVIPQDYLDLAS